MSSLHTKTRFISGDEEVVIAGKDLCKSAIFTRLIVCRKIF